jgi:hypothetical protein
MEVPPPVFPAILVRLRRFGRCLFYPLAGHATLTTQSPRIRHLGQHLFEERSRFGGKEAAALRASVQFQGCRTRPLPRSSIWIAPVGQAFAHAPQAMQASGCTSKGVLTRRSIPRPTKHRAAALRTLLHVQPHLARLKPDSRRQPVLTGRARESSQETAPLADADQDVQSPTGLIRWHDGLL